MKAGLTVVIGLFLWLTFLFLREVYLIQLLNLKLASLTVALLAGIYWLTKKDNRTTLFFLLRARGFKALIESLTNGSFRAYMIAIATIVILFFQGLQFLVSNSEAYEHLTSAIKEDPELISEIGQIKLIGLDHSFNYKTKNRRSELDVSLVVFGEQQTKTLSANISGVEGNWDVNY